MSESLANAVSTVAFIALLATSIWWLRSRRNHWSSADGLRCIGQMNIALDEHGHAWKEVRLLIDKNSRVVACKARGRHSQLLSGNWSVIGRPHESHIDAGSVNFCHYAVTRVGNDDAVAIIRVPRNSPSASALNALLPS